GAKAIATGSYSVAMAHGYDDREALPLDLALANAERIVNAVELPVSIDFEGAYAEAPEGGASNMARLQATGAVGCNFEDQVVGGLGPLPARPRRRAADRPRLRGEPAPGQHHGDDRRSAGRSAGRVGRRPDQPCGRAVAARHAGPQAGGGGNLWLK